MSSSIEGTVPPENSRNKQSSGTDSGHNGEGKRSKAVVSSLLTVGVVVLIVAVVYSVLPARDNEFLEEALFRFDAQKQWTPKQWDLIEPNPQTLRAWSVGVLGKQAPGFIDSWPVAKVTQGIHLARKFAVYELVWSDERILVLVQTTRDAFPVKRKKIAGDVIVVSRRRKKWTIVAVGSKATAEEWAPIVFAKKYQF